MENAKEEYSPKPMIPSTVAAARFGVTNDYVALLCRQKKVHGVLMGRVWYVEPNALSAFLEQSQRERTARNAELKEKLKTEYHNKIGVEKETYTKQNISTSLKSPIVYDFFAPAAFAFFVIAGFALQAYAGGGALFANYEPIKMGWQPLPRPMVVLPTPLAQETLGPTLQDIADAVVYGLEYAPQGPTLPAYTPPPALTPTLTGFVARELSQTNFNIARVLGGLQSAHQSASIASAITDGWCIFITLFNKNACADVSLENNVSTYTYVVTPAKVAVEITAPAAPTNFVPSVAPATVPTTKSAVTPVQVAVAPVSQTVASKYVTQDVFSQKLDELSNSLKSLVYNQVSVPGSLPATGGITNVISLIQKIDKLDGVTITNSTFNGSASVGGGASTLAALTDVSLTTPAWGSLLYYNGSAWSSIATSSLGITGSGGVGTGSAGYLPYYAASGTTLTATSSIFIDTTTAKIGIGTTTPGSTLSVVGSGAFYSNSGTTISINSYRESTLGGNLTLFHARGTAESPSPLSANDNAGNIYFNAMESDGVSRLAANITGIYLGNNSGKLSFRVNNTPDEKMFIDNNGMFVLSNKFAVGTSTPTGQIEASASNAATTLTTFGNPNIVIANRSTTNNSFATLAFRTQDLTNAAATSTAHISGIGTSHVAGASSGALAFLTLNAGQLAEAMRISPAGNLGIGTTSPTSKLSVVGSNTNNEVVTFINTGTGSGDEVLHLGVGGATAGTSNLFVAFYQGSSATTMGTRIGYIQGSGSNSVTYNTTSDRRLKEHIATTTAGLAELLRIGVKDFNFINSSSTVQGFIAQDLITVYPDAVAKTDNGTEPLGASTVPWGVDYGRITPLIVKAVQDIANLTATFKNTLIAWFADAQNGITKLFAKEVHTDKLCVGTTCVTEEQFLALVNGAISGGGSEESAPVVPIPEQTPDATSTPSMPDTPAEEPPAETPEQEVVEPAPTPAPEAVTTPEPTAPAGEPTALAN